MYGQEDESTETSGNDVPAKVLCRDGTNHHGQRANPQSLLDFQEDESTETSGNDVPAKVLCRDGTNHHGQRANPQSLLDFPS
mmetsp:Transcript_56008/g.122725  ORF Transcript_56008/g.122725 Transcript_56008/m.122725 type:complete len:82 (-) Transcript_56008:307-552(-)